MCIQRTSVSYLNEAIGESISNVPETLKEHLQYGGALQWLEAKYPGVTDADHKRYYVLVAENAMCVEACANVRKVVESEGIVSTKDTWQG